MTLPLDRHWKNLTWIFSVEIFWGVGLALISNIAILPVFLTHLGASNTTVGALPVLFLLATGLPGIFAAHFTGRLAYRKRFVIVGHALTAVPWLLTAAWFIYGPRISSTVDIAVLIGGWGLSWAWMGVLLPVWLNFIGKVTRPELRARSFGIIFFFQTLMSAVGGWIASKIIGGGAPFPANYGIGFAITGAAMAIGGLFFAPVVEEAGELAAEEAPMRGIVRHAREILTDRGGIRTYLSIYMLAAGWPLLTAFYPIWAEKRFSLEPKDSAIYTAVCMAGNMAGSLFAGAIGDRFGYAKVAVIASVAFCVGLGTAILGDSRPWYYATAFVLGVYIVSDRLALINLSMAFSPHDDNTSYLALVPALATPLMVLGAALCGPLIDAYGFVVVAVGAAALGLVGVYLAVFRLPEPRYSLVGKRRP
ncbi:MAG TPA: MFS transporter [Candidatus Eisenbacteria bacterium]|nr:MFS transporter [Candidatus Eisenbacteria bacterium]